MKHADPANRMNIASDTSRRYQRVCCFPEGSGKFLNGRMVAPVGYEFVEAWSCDDLRVRVLQLVHAATRRPVFDWPDAGSQDSPPAAAGELRRGVEDPPRREHGEKQGGGV